MEDFDWSQFPHDDFHEAKKFACEFYRTIERVKCPALNDEHISFTSKGIRHILFKKSRTHTQIIERLSCLRYVEQILTDPNPIIELRRKSENEYVKQNGEYKLIEVDSQYWTFKKAITPLLVIKIVIRQTDTKGKYFYSIIKMDRHKQ